MTAAGRAEVRTSSIRVALAATAIVAIAYLIVCVAVVVIVTSGLTREIDRRLAESLDRIAQGPPPGGPGHGYDATGRRTEVRSAAARLDGPPGWHRRPRTRPTRRCPPRIRAVTGPTTVTIGDARSGSGLPPTPVGLRRRRPDDRRGRPGQDHGHPGRADHRPDPAHRRLPRRGRDRPAGRRADRAGPRPPARVHRRRVARAADAAVGHRGAHEPRPGPGPRRGRVVPHRVRQDRRREQADAPAGRGPPLARPVRRDEGAARRPAGRPRRPRHRDRRPLPGRRRGAPAPTRAAESSPAITSCASRRSGSIGSLGVLLDNACKYAPDGERRSSSRSRPTAGGCGSRSTTPGPGIPEEERGRIFDRFHRATDSTGGAGLGLAIADAIVRATGGRWRVGASPAGGASLSVAWRRGSTGARRSTPRPAKARNRSDTGSRRLLGRQSVHHGRSDSPCRETRAAGCDHAGSSQMHRQPARPGSRAAVGDRLTEPSRRLVAPRPVPDRARSRVRRDRRRQHRWPTSSSTALLRGAVSAQRGERRRPGRHRGREHDREPAADVRRPRPIGLPRRPGGRSRRLRDRPGDHLRLDRPARGARRRGAGLRTGDRRDRRGERPRDRRPLSRPAVVDGSPPPGRRRHRPAAVPEGASHDHRRQPARSACPRPARTPGARSRGRSSARSTRRPGSDPRSSG